MVRKKVSITMFILIFTTYLVQPAFPANAAPAAPQAPAPAVTARADVNPSVASSDRVTVNFRDVEIKTVLHYLSEVSGVDIIPTPDVDALVTMRLRNKPWEVALDIVTRNYGFAYSKDDEQGIIRVMPRSRLNTEEPITVVIPLNNLIREIELRKDESAGAEEVSVQETERSIEQLMVAIGSVLDQRLGERATFIPSVSSIVVTAIPSRINTIREMVAEIDRKTPQVVLDIKIVEIGLTSDERFGVDWNAIISAAGARQPITLPFTSAGLLSALPGDVQTMFQPKYGVQGTNENSRFPYLGAQLVDPTAAPTANSLFSYGTLDFSTFTATLSLLDQRGDTEIISSPKITTLDNQKASIKVIDKLMLQKSIESTDAARTVTVEFDSEDEAREVGVKLTVVPHVNETGDITVNLLPEVSTNQGFSLLPIGGGTGGVAQPINTYSLTFSSREANTIIRVKDGETIFLGGLIRKNIVITDNKFPILGDLFGGIPVVGNIFKYEAEQVTRTELVFFVTVHLVDDGLEAIEEAGALNTYNRYKEEGFFIDRNPTPVVRQGVLKEKTEDVEINIPKRGPFDEKEHKPLIDFRKKKEE